MNRHCDTITKKSAVSLAKILFLKQQVIFKDAVILFILFAEYGRPVAKFGHDTGRRFLIVRGPTLKNYYAKNIKDRDLIFVALSF